MIDLRFYEALGPISVKALAGALHAEGALERPISGVAPLDRAGPADLCYLDGARPRAPLPSRAGACIVTADALPLVPHANAHIVAAAPRAAFARLAGMLFRLKDFGAGEARIDPDARLEPGVRVAAGAVIGARAQIGADSVIGPNAVIWPGVAIGRRTRIGAGAAIRCALIGDDVEIFSGAVIGERGFGVAADAAGLVDVPHFGRVIIQDRVTIGANTAIDRGLFDDTTIGEETKIDNLCHIAHNVEVGRRVLMAAFAGISGSTKIGDGVILAGRVGVTDHRTIGAGATLAAGSAVLQDVPAGETWVGYPAKQSRAWMRELAWVKSKALGKRDGGR
ncbi:MAG: UDP-3-O-(3-hydroxymyristoyl)glucosamine N-acyltransferase [Hyphomonadaceae bacterium]